MKLFPRVPSAPTAPPTVTVEPELKANQKPLSSLVASARRITSESLRGDTGRSRVTTQEAWQDDAWEMYDLVGEQRFLASTLANRLSKARFYVGAMEGDGTDEPTPVEDEQVQAILKSIGHTSAGLEQIIQRLGVNLFIAGDAWLVGAPPDLLPKSVRQSDVVGRDRRGALPSVDEVNIDELEWRTLSVSEIGATVEGRVTLSFGDGKDDTVAVNPDDVYLLRVWRPHPRRWWRADSPTRSSLPTLRELVGLTMKNNAQIDSRLAGAGLLLIPQSLRSALLAAAGLPEDTEEDPLLDALMDAMMTPIRDRESASAIVPLTITVPDESVDKVKHLTFSTPSDEGDSDKQDKAIRRLALGQDAPPELLLGTAGMNHWGAWLVNEDVVSTHLEPPLALICDAFTTQFLWPVLRALGKAEDEVRRYVVWYDVDHLIVRPNRGSTAQTLHAAGAISAEALRDANGFDENDAPSETAALDPAITTALELVQNAPSLAQDPGLPALVEQVRAVLAGEAAPTPDTNDDGDGDGSDGGEAPDSEPSIPDTDEAPADTPDESMARQ